MLIVKKIFLFLFLSCILNIKIALANESTQSEYKAHKCSNLFASAHSKFIEVKNQVQAKVIGQEDLVNKILIALLMRGHILIEGPSGTAKTRVVNVLAQLFRASFKSELMTTDTNPAVLRGESIFNPQTQKYIFHEGVLFSNFVLADEINRAHPRVQNTLLQAMEEHKVTVNSKDYPMEKVFMLLATQNPTTDLGTYAQSVALGDRFGISILVNHANQETETAILDLILNERRAKFKNQTNSSDTNTDSAIDLTNPQTPVENKFTLADILEAQEEVINVHVSKEVARYITLITDITRTPSTYTNGPSSSSLKHISEGISFRGTQAMLFGAQAVAWLDGRNTVEIQDVDAIVKDVLRHRLKIDEVARIESLNVDSIIEQLTIVASRKINENP